MVSCINSMKATLACGFLTCTDIQINHHYFLVQDILDIMSVEAIISCILYWSFGQTRTQNISTC